MRENDYIIDDREHNIIFEKIKKMTDAEFEEYCKELMNEEESDK